jgi:hypothetical protein
MRDGEDRLTTADVASAATPAADRETGDVETDRDISDGDRNVVEQRERVRSSSGTREAPVHDAPADQRIRDDRTLAEPSAAMDRPDRAGRRPEPAPAAARHDRGALLPTTETGELRTKWESIQTAFVDQPRHSVEEADALVARAMTRVAEVFSEERAMLERQWSRGEEVSTEDLRVALTRYRSFFDRLLSV